MCVICGYQNVDNAPFNLFTEEDFERLISGIFTRIITPQNLDYRTYIKTAEKLTEGIYSGYGKTINDVLLNEPDYLMLRDLRENVYIFSGAKTYQATKAVSALLTEGDAVTSYTSFREKALPLLNEFYDNYLRAEYNSAIAQAQTASFWQEIEADKGSFPMLVYKTVGDGRVRPEHASLDGIARPVDDKFWSTYMPPNGWNCRCRVGQEMADYPKTSLRGFKKPDSVPDIFQFNAGKEKIIFSKKHPYFKVARKDKALAKMNFGLPLP